MAIGKIKKPGITDPSGDLYKRALAQSGSTGAVNTGALPFKVSEGTTFGTADQNQQSLLRNAANLYGSGESWVESLNPLRTTGKFVSYMDENGMPVGALRSVSGPTNGEYLWALNGKMATGAVPEGTIVYAPDGSRWSVGKDGSLSNAGTYTPPASANTAGSVSGGISGSISGKSTGTSPETPYMAALNAYDSAPTYGGSPYDAQRDEYLQRAGNMSFSYDPTTDPSWQAYQKQYRREGQRAAQDTLGQYAAMTGGSPSSWAMTAASQAGDYYGAQLADKLPQLYQDAYNRYLQEYQQMLGLSQEYGALGQTDYNRYLDQLGQFNTDRNFQYGLDRDAVADARYAQEYADQRADLDWDRQYTLDRDAAADAQYEQTYADQRADADRNWQYELALQAADRGDNSMLEAMGINPASTGVYAYSPDGGTYQIGTDKGMYFLDNAQPGQTMTGGDGSVWTKNADGSVTITKGGKTYTIGGQGYSPYPGYSVNPYADYVAEADAQETGRRAATVSPQKAQQLATEFNARIQDVNDYWSGQGNTGAEGTAGNVTNLDYDQDEGIFRWNGKTYGSLSDIATAIDAAGLSDAQLKALVKKFRQYGFTLSFN